MAMVVVLVNFPRLDPLCLPRLQVSLYSYPAAARPLPSSDLHRQKRQSRWGIRRIVYLNSLYQASYPQEWPQAHRRTCAHTSDPCFLHLPRLPACRWRSSRRHRNEDTALQTTCLCSRTQVELGKVGWGVGVAANRYG